MPGKKQILINMNSLLAVLYTVCAYMVIFAPYQSNSPMYNASMGAFFRYFQYLVAALALLHIARCKKVKRISVLPILACLIAVIIPYFQSYTESELSGFLMILLIIAFMFSMEDCQCSTYVYFRRVWVVLSIIGLICYASYLLSLPLPYRIINYYGREIEGVTQNYVTYGFIFLHKQSMMIRLCGICNEPGWWGTISALLLCADGLNLKKKENWVILAAGIASASLAFILLMAVYVLFLVRKHKKVFFVVLVLLLVYFFALPNIDTGNEALNYLISRMAITDGRLAGDNRSTTAVNSVLARTMQEHPFFGFGSGYAEEYTGSLSIKIYLINYGIVGTLLMYLPLLVGAIIYSDRVLSCYFFIAVFFLSAYQRPGIFMTTYIVLLFGGIEYIKRNELRDLESVESVS